MRIPIKSRLIVSSFVLAAGVVLAAQGPETIERRLSNGMRVLVVERPGGGMIHAALFVRGGRSDTGGLPPAAAELLCRSLFRRCTDQDLDDSPSLKSRVQKEEGLYESMRRETLQLERSAEQVDATFPATLPAAHPALLPAALPEVAWLQSQAMDALRTALGSDADLDRFERLGVVNRSSVATEDLIATTLDLPANQLAAWANLETQRLTQAHLFRLPVERERWLAEMRRKSTPQSGLSALLGTAFVGHPYASALDENPSVIAGLGWEDERALATRLFSPERMMLVLVGETSAEESAGTLEKTFGKLGSKVPEQEPFPSEISFASGALRLEMFRPGPPRIFMAWRVPPSSHPDTPALEFTAHVLGMGTSARLRTLVTRGLAQSAEVKQGVPGTRAANLFMVTAEPEEGHSLAELEISVRGEILRLQEELVPGDEFQKALRQIELQRLNVESDPATLASALGTAWATLGNWRQAFISAKRLRDARPEEIQRAARQYLALDHVVVGLVEPDRADSEDPLDRKLAKALRTLARRKGVEPAKAEVLVQEGLRQLRMLPREQRAATLKLLEPGTKEAP